MVNRVASPAALGLGAPRTRPVALSIAGSDAGGGAGVAADIKTFEAHGVWATLAVTAVTAQNTLGVQTREVMSPEMVRAQMASVVVDIGVDAAKTGMLAHSGMVEAVAAGVRDLGIRRLVVDPVIASGQGDILLSADGITALTTLLLPLATVVTPNLAEAASLAGVGEITDRAGMEEAARALAALGPAVIMITGGHLTDDPGPDHVPDLDPAPRARIGHTFTRDELAGTAPPNGDRRTTGRADAAGSAWRQRAGPERTRVTAGVSAGREIFALGQQSPRRARPHRAPAPRPAADPATRDPDRCRRGLRARHRIRRPDGRAQTAGPAEHRRAELTAW